MISARQSYPKILFVFVVGVVLGLSVSVGNVSGHVVSFFYGPEWQGDRAFGVGWLHSPISNTTAVVTINGSVTQWNVSAAMFEFTPYQGRNTSVVWTGSTCTTGYPNQIWAMSKDVSNDFLAIEQSCLMGGNLYRSNIRIDTRNNWDYDQGSTPSNQYDLRSVMVHEFGHSTGFGNGSQGSHFDEDDVFCDVEFRHTMCPSIGMGQTHARTIELHDDHTFDGAY